MNNGDNTINNEKLEALNKEQQRKWPWIQISIFIFKTLFENHNVCGQKNE